MKASLAFALLFCATGPCFAAASLSQQIDPPEANVGDAVVVTYTIQNGSGTNVHLPAVDGLQLIGTRSDVKLMIDQGSISSAHSESFQVSPLHPGDFTIPAFDIHLQDGGTLRTREMKLHVLSSGTAPPPNAQPSAPTPVPQAPAAVQNFNPNGPVVFPPNNPNPTPTAPTTPTPADPANTTLSVPTESDGRPAKVFIGIKPQTTDAYVGQSIPLKIEFYIRLDSIAQQDSLPTIKGSDFLMNSLSPRFREDEIGLMNEGFARQSWFTAISAPKSGDFPLQMERDTYWVKSDPNSDPNQNFFPARANLAHQLVASNQMTIHVHTLPEDGKPANFTGAIGQFTVTGGAQPQTVAVGEPVTLHFTVSGSGNFDYVRCPTLPHDPNWKTYVPSSKIEYQEESHTQANKSFDMAVIPKKNGVVPLPQASFSYFDPTAKKYVTVPIDLPPITVTGSMPSAAPLPTADASGTTTTTQVANDLLPNRDDPGSLQTSFKPIYWQPWFWAVQGGLFSALVLGGLILFLRSRRKPDTRLSERLARQQSLDHEIDAMSAAVIGKDAVAFFVAARHAVQLHLSTEWNVKPETLTLAEIRQRDPEMAQTLEPLFLQTDEIVYSGGTAKGLDLAQWGRHVSELLQTSPPNHDPLFLIPAVLPIVLLVLCSFLPHLLADEDPELAAANRAYTYGSYDEAAGLFQKMILARGYSAALCFNLANAEAKAGHPGLALLNYERARYLAPGDADINHNLQMERKQAGLQPNSFRWWQVLMRSINRTFWLALILSGLALLFMALIGTVYATALASMLKMPVPTLRKIFKGIFFIFIPLTLLFGFVELACLGFNARIEGVIIAPGEATLRISPIDGTEKVGTIPEGELVTVEKSYADYFYIEGRDHHYGWISKKEIEPVIADSFNDQPRNPSSP